MATSRENIQLGKGQAFRLLRWAQDISKVEELTAPGKAIPVQGRGDHWHYHPQTELTLIQQGEGTRFIADHIELFEPGDLVLIGSNVPHYWHVRGKSSGLAIQWHFPLQHGIWDFNEADALRKLEDAARKGLRLSGATAAKVRLLMENMHALGGLPRLTSLLTIIATLADAPEKDVRALSARPFSLSGTDEHQEAIRRAVSYIIAHFRGPVRLPALLELTGMSRATFSRQFQLHAGRSFSTFLNQVRLQAVCRALRDSKEPITSIALENGFNQLSFFNRLFRREFGINPSAYRQKGLTKAILSGGGASTPEESA
ncbi:MAG TPA: AraC family transcriptional regulator [Luteolibacter sp.]|nr:AraC family transcriptional regulator [Luteolibacter sp.]